MPQKLEKRFMSLRLPTLFLVHLLHRSYMHLCRTNIENFLALLTKVGHWAFWYASRWNCTASDPTNALLDCMTGKEGEAPWCSFYISSTINPTQLWWIIAGRNRALPSGMQCLAEVANRLFSVLPSILGPERLFSELGCPLIPSAVCLSHQMVQDLPMISADVLHRKVKK